MVQLKRTRQMFVVPSATIATKNGLLTRQKSQRKRARISPDGVHHPKSLTSEDDSSDSDHLDTSKSLPQTQYELMRDAGFRHLNNAHQDDIEATQKLQRRPERLGQNVVAESGIIQSLTCYNFMCHERLHIKLGPLINFIVGENGSGKSAVLTALTLCLGGKACDTNRGGSLRSFIKEGEEHCSLVINIKNSGTDAYHPDVYGNCIKIERHFSRSGTSGFRIKSEFDRIISTKKQEIDEISEWFLLQISNPLTVLSQDNARQFLNSTSPTQKYKYFVSGVQLEQLDNDYKLSLDTLEKTIYLRDELHRQVNVIKKAMSGAAKLVETVQKNKTLRERAKVYRDQLIWSQVIEREIELEGQAREVAACDSLISEIGAECEEVARSLREIEANLQQVDLSKRNLQDVRFIFYDDICAAEKALQIAKRELKKLHLDQRDAYERLKIAKAEVEICEAKICEEEHRLTGSSGKARAAKERDLEKSLMQEKILTEKVTETLAQIPLLQSQLSKTENTLLKQEHRREIKRKEFADLSRAARNLEQDSGSLWGGYDKELTELKEALRADAGFEHEPIGPLGAHIRLLKAEWSGILDKMLGDTLNAFVVRSKRDQARLLSHVTQKGGWKQPPVFIAYGGTIDTRGQEPNGDYDTVARVMEFDDDLVRSQLVINQQIEKVILVQDRLEAQHIMMERDPPKNVTACICFHDGADKRGHGLRITNRFGSIGMSPIHPNHSKPRMQTDSIQQLALQQENLRHLASGLLEIENAERSAQEFLQSCKEDFEGTRKQHADLSNKLRQTQAEVESIQHEMDAFEGTDTRLKTLRTVLQRKVQDTEQLGAQYGHMGVMKKDLGGEVEKARQNLILAKSHAQEHQDRVSKANAEFQRHESLWRIALGEKNDIFDKLDRERFRRSAVEARRLRKAREVERLTREAEQLCPVRVCVPEGEDYRSIEKKYERIGEQLALRESKMGASDVEIYDRASDTRARYEEAVRQMHNTDETIASLKRSIERRLHLWRQWQRQISARTRIQFNYLLSERGFRGKIELNHQKRRILIHIEPDETRRKASGRSTKTLSGGEKSFSSICMLLSIWEAIGSPIRCLDEFDVFMDNVNRAISTNMLVCRQSILSRDG